MHFKNVKMIDAILTYMLSTVQNFNYFILQNVNVYCRPGVKKVVVKGEGPNGSQKGVGGEGCREKYNFL